MMLMGCEPDPCHEHPVGVVSMTLAESLVDPVFTPGFSGVCQCQPCVDKPVLGDQTAVVMMSSQAPGNEVSVRIYLPERPGVQRALAMTFRVEDGAVTGSRLDAMYPVSLFETLGYTD